MQWINIRCVPDPSANTGGFATVYKPDAEHAGRPIPMGVKVESALPCAHERIIACCAAIAWPETLD